MGVDDVTQFCVEEAVFERLAHLEARAGALLENAGGELPAMPPLLEDPAVREALDRAREFAGQG